MNRRKVATAVVVAAMFALAGCAASGPPVPFGTHEVTDDTDRPAADIAGTLMLSEGCLMVERDGHGLPVVLPDVATWDEQAQAVTIDGVTFNVGDDVSWGGGYGPGADVPDSCPAGVEVARVYETS